MKRRQFIQSTAGAGVTLAAGLLPFAARAASLRVVVVGGGMAGAAVAKFIRLWSKGEISVVLDREGRVVRVQHPE
ncbi:MAG: twin-arginine translocation signal domain-containing protein [Burkholderiaceae bacterium]